MPTIETTPAFGGLLDLKIGWNAETDALVKVEFNRQTNNYLAVTGKPGSGKTQFVKDLLAQIRLQSEFKVKVPPPEAVALLFRPRRCATTG